MLDIRSSWPVDQILVVVAKHVGQILLTTGHHHGQGVGELVRLVLLGDRVAHDSREDVDNLGRRTELGHGVQGRPQEKELPRGRVYAYLTDLGEDHGAVTVTGTVTLTDGRAALVIFTVVVPTSTPVTRPVELTVAMAGAALS